MDTSGKTEEEIENEQVKVVAKRSTKKMSEVRVETLQLVHMHKQDPMVIWQKLMVTHQA